MIKKIDKIIYILSCLTTPLIFLMLGEIFIYMKYCLDNKQPIDFDHMVKNQSKYERFYIPNIIFWYFIYYMLFIK